MEHGKERVHRTTATSQTDSRQCDRATRLTPEASRAVALSNLKRYPDTCTDGRLDRRFTGASTVNDRVEDAMGKQRGASSTVAVLPADENWSSMSNHLNVQTWCSRATRPSVVISGGLSHRAINRLVKQDLASSTPSFEEGTTTIGEAVAFHTLDRIPE